MQIPDSSRQLPHPGHQRTDEIRKLAVAVLRAYTYYNHLADVPAAEFRVRGILHIEHPAGDENAQPCQEKVLHLNGWESALCGGRNKEEGVMRNHGGNKLKPQLLKDLLVG